MDENKRRDRRRRGEAPPPNPAKARKPLGVELDPLPPEPDDTAADPRRLTATARAPKPLTLNPWRGEAQQHHRGLLLLAMQDPGSNRAPVSTGVCDGRSLEAVVRCFRGERSRSAVRGWMGSKQWAERIAAHGPDAQRYAVTLYRRLYLEQYGRADMEILGPVISVPLTSYGDAPGEETTEVQEAATALLDRVLAAEDPPTPGSAGEPPESAQRAVTEARRLRREKAIRANTELAATVRAAAATVQQGLKAALDPAWAKENPHVRPVHARVQDMPALRALAKDLEDEATRLEGLQVDSGSRVIDSARVAVAKELGLPVLPAIYEDLKDATIIVQQLMARPMTVEQLRDEQPDGAVPREPVAAEAPR